MGKIVYSFTNKRVKKIVYLHKAKKAHSTYSYTKYETRLLPAAEGWVGALSGDPGVDPPKSCEEYISTIMLKYNR